MQQDAPLNVLGEPMSPCSASPLTGFFRDGYCNTCREDRGAHTVCARVSSEFLAFSASRGNDLSSPQPAYGFAGLSDGDRWCLCAGRWVEAYENEAAPRVYLKSTHQRSLEVIPIEVLRRFALDLS
ncbi:MAG: DUF2237 family protein [Lysobacterales bacterium]